MKGHRLTETLYGLLGLRIRRRREELKLTQQALAKAVGVSRASIANVERGRHYAPVHLLLGVAEQMDCEISDLLPSRAELEAMYESSKIPKMATIAGKTGPLPSKAAMLVSELLGRGGMAKAPPQPQSTSDSPPRPLSKQHTGPTEHATTARSTNVASDRMAKRSSQHVTPPKAHP